MSTIKDIAKALNIGVSTVSMALNGNPKISKETREKVLNKAKELNYVKNGIAVDLQRKSTNLILLVVDDASRPYFSRTINTVQKKVNEYEYDLLISTTFNGQVGTAKRYISERRVDGVIVFTNRIDDEFIKQYACKEMPIFVIGRYLMDEYVFSDPNSTLDHGVNVITHLYSRGCRKIAFVTSLSHTLGSIRRFESYKKGLKKHGLPYDESLVYHANGSEYEDGYRITKQIVKDIDKIDGIFYSNDDIAIPGVRCLINHGIDVGKQVAVVGYNDLPSSKLISPALTTVTTNQKISSTYAVDVLINVIKGNPIDLITKEYQDKRLLLKDQLIIRET